MKYPIIISILILISTYSISQNQPLKVGDNIYREFKKLKKTSEITAPAIGPWVEETKIKITGSKSDVNFDNRIFFSSEDNKVFAVKNVKKDKVFLIDMDGDSIIDLASKVLWIPYGIIKGKTNITSQDTSVLALLDNMYEKTLQADLSKKVDTKSLKQYEKYQTDRKMANRYIMYLFDSYQKFVMQANSNNEHQPDNICIPIMKYLSEECNAVFHRIPAIVCIYMGEALLSAGMDDKAREHFKMSLQLYPNSIPLQVYDFRLEKDLSVKKQKLALLKKNHPDHWMVQGL